MNNLVLFITSEVKVVGGEHVYDYNDRILQNIVNTNIYEIFYSGQDKGRSDQRLLDTIDNNQNVLIFYRRDNNSSFTFLGETTNYKVVQYRTLPIGESTEQNERLQLHFVIDNPMNTNIPQIFTGTCRYKYDVQYYLGLIDNEKNKMTEILGNPLEGFIRF